MEEAKNYCERKINLLKSNYDQLLEVCLSLCYVETLDNALKGYWLSFWFISVNKQYRLLVILGVLCYMRSNELNIPQIFITCKSTDMMEYAVLIFVFKSIIPVIFLPTQKYRCNAILTFVPLLLKSVWCSCLSLFKTCFVMHAHHLSEAFVI